MVRELNQPDGLPAKQLSYSNSIGQIVYLITLYLNMHAE